MRNFNEYNKNPNDKKVKSGIKIFQNQLKSLEGADIEIDGISSRGIVLNHLNDLAEDKEDRGLNVEVDTQIKKGSYVKYDNDIYIVVTDIDNHYFYKNMKIRRCNNTLNAKGWNKPIPCYLNGSSYGVKGVIDTDYLSLIDGKKACLVQDNANAKAIPLGMRFIFDHDENEVYKVVRTETAETGLDKLRQIILDKDTSKDKDDFVNNIAYNEFQNKGEVIPTPTNTYNIVSKTGVLSIKWFLDNTFKIVDSNGADDTNNWTITVDQNGLASGFITIKSTTNNSVTITNNSGYSRTSIKIKFVKGSDVLEAEVKLVK